MKLDADTVRKLLAELIDKITSLEDDAQPQQTITFAFYPAITEAEED